MTDAPDFTDPVATPPPTSVLFPTISPEDYAGWTEQAKALSTPELQCDADDAILAAHLLGFGEHILATGDASVRTAAMRRLFAGKSPTSLRALVVLAKAVRKLQREALSPSDPTAAPGEQLALMGMQLTSALATVLVAVAPDVKRAKHPKG